MGRNGTKVRNPGSGGGFSPSQAAPLLGDGAGRLDLSSATELAWHAYLGDARIVNGEVVSFSTPITIDIADNTIDLNGEDSGNPPTDDITHYVYLSNSLATDFPLEIRLSTANAAGVIDGYEYLNSSGNGTNWLKIGICHPTGGNFVDSLTQRFVMSFFNRLPKGLVACPNYNDNNAQTTYTIGTATTQYQLVTGGDLEFLTFEDTDIEITVNVQVTIGTWGAGIGNDYGGSSIVVACTPATSSRIGVLPAQFQVNNGYNIVNLLLRQTTGTSATFIADDARNGATEDPFCTYIEGLIWG